MATINIVSSQRTRLGQHQLYPRVKLPVEESKLRELLAADGGHGRTLIAAGIIRVLEDGASSPKPAIDGALADATGEIERLRYELARADHETGRVKDAHAEELESLGREAARLEGERGRERDEHVATIARLEARVAELEKAPGAAPSSEVAALVALTAEELKEKIGKITDGKLLFSVYEAESGAKNRSTVLRAIEAREAELGGTAKAG